MSFFNDIGDALDALGHSAHRTFDTTFHAAMVPFAVGLDVAQGVFEGGGDMLHGDLIPGGAIHHLAHNLSEDGETLVKPFTDGKTWTGYTFKKTQEGMAWAYHKVDRPLSTAAIMGQAAGGSDPVRNYLLHGIVKGDWSPDLDLDTLFDPQKWAEAWEIADHQTTGQSIMYRELETDRNPFSEYDSTKNIKSVRNPETGEVVKLDHPLTPYEKRLADNIWANIGAGATDLAIAWYTDPTVVAGRVANTLYRTATMRSLGTLDRVGMLGKVGGDGLSSVNKKAAGLANAHWDRISGLEAGRSPLNWREIYETTPVLKDSTNGRLVAQQMAEIAKMGAEGNPDAKKLYQLTLATTLGDPEALQALAARGNAGKALSMAFDNVLRGGGLDLETQALNEFARFEPEMFHRLDEQLKAQDLTGDLTKFAKTWKTQIQARTNLLDRAKEAADEPLVGMPRVGILGEKSGLKRANENRLIDKGASLHDAVMEKAAEYATRPQTNLWQQGLHMAPLMLAKFASPFVSPYTGKFEKGFMDAMRGQHFTGQLDTHDWPGALRQLEAYMTMGRVPAPARNEILGKAGSAVSEGDKTAAASTVVTQTLKALSDHYAPKLGLDDGIDGDFIREVVRRNMSEQKAAYTAFDAQQYSATRLPDELKNNEFYQAKIAKAEQEANERFAKGEQAWSGDEVPQREWRIDHIDVEGRNVAMPLFESQLANTILLPDIQSIDKALQREATHSRLKRVGDEWVAQAKELSAATKAKAAARSGAVSFLNNRIHNAEQAMDMLSQLGTILLRGWKFGVLMRLGYPQRVLADDHLRMANKLNWMSEIAAPGATEGAANVLHNRLPRFVPGTRARAGSKLFRQAQFEYDALRQATIGHASADDLKALRAAAGKAFGRKGTDEDVAELERMFGDNGIDPEGHIAEWFHHRSAAQTRKRSIAGKKKAIKQWENDTYKGRKLSPQEKSQKIAAARQDIERLDAELSYHVEQMPDEDPFQVRDELERMGDVLALGRKEFLPEKRRMGQRGSTILGLDAEGRIAEGGKYRAQGSIEGEGKDFLAFASSKGTFDQLAYGPEGKQSAFQRARSFRTITPDRPHYAHAWKDILNTQIRHSRVAMFFVKNPKASIDDFVEWIGEPEQAGIRARIPWFAHDPEDWGGRVRQMIKEYVPNEDVRLALAKKGRVTRADLKTVPEEHRPIIHGQEVDVNTGRSLPAQWLSRGYEKMFEKVGELPTDTLSRHPFFNAMYRRELQDIADREITYAKQQGRTQFGPEDINEWERRARKAALAHVKKTLWDISAHSHAGHAMRFLSPFFTAHMEAMSRWWRIVRDDPAVVRRFNMIYDAPRNMGLVYDADTGQPVKPGEAISTNHRIVFRIPDLKTGNSFVDGWLKKLGGGWNFSIGENGLNIILQNGVVNPGTGPLVTVPVTELAKHYAEDPTITRFANMVNPYPHPGDTSLKGVLGSAAAGFEPGLVRKFFDYMDARSNDTSNYGYAMAFVDRLTENVIDYRKAHGGAFPSAKAWDRLTDEAGKDAQHDLFLEFLSAGVGFTPARAEGKYAAIQRGWEQIQSQGRAEGKDYDWMKRQFRKKYRDVYMPLLYSRSVDPARLAGTPGEVSAVKKLRPLIRHLDNSRVARVVVGPTAAMSAEASPATGVHTREAYSWLQHANVLGDGSSLMGTKDPEASVVDGMVNEGWEDYDKQMNNITVAAQRAGIVDAAGVVRWSDPRVRSIKSQMIDRLQSRNPEWGKDYEARTGSSYDSILDDLERVASNKILQKETERTDVKVLGEYLTERKKLSEALQYLSNHGQVHTPGAKALAPLFSHFQQVVDHLRDSNTYFDQYAFDGIIEFDPYYQAGLDAEPALAGSE